MKIVKYLSLFVFIFSSYLIANCNSEQTDIGGDCYHTADLNVLVEFADSSGVSNPEHAEALNMWSDITTDANGRIISLNCLYLNCDISGPIPSSIGNLTELYSLYFYGSVNVDHLTGSIPSAIESLTKLATLFILEHELEGPIPKEIGSLSSLTSLVLTGNNLSGFIPAEIGNLTRLEGLSLDDNNLSGTIPTEIGNLTELTGLHLNNNSLTGLIPDSFCNLSGISLTLSDNNFCPPYPVCPLGNTGNEAPVTTEWDQDTSNCP